ncbi:MAG: response regulator transcription factor [Lachnospiraceae bacterium]|nr:response regulator transcription factor [Lachnospiraceae bacterium]
MAAKVLIVDDEKLIVKGIKFSLEQDGYETDCAYDGEEALEMAGAKDYDIILLDLMLPKLDGYEVCQRIREFSKTPIIMLTAKGDDMDKILGLDYGADDYMTKPFNILEVKARIKAVMRRSRKEETVGPKGETLSAGGLTLDLENRRTFKGNEEIPLTSKEFEIIRILMENPGKVYKREDLLRAVWGGDYPGDERTVDVHVRRLREKIESDAGNPMYVHTRWGIGYYFSVTAQGN